MIISSSREFSHYINNNYPKKEKEKKARCKDLRKSGNDSNSHNGLTEKAVSPPTLSFQNHIFIGAKNIYNSKYGG